MSYSDLPVDYRQTFGRYTYLFKCIGLDFFDNSTSYVSWNKIKLLLFCITFYPFISTQFSLLSEIRADNFLEGVRVLPVDIMFAHDIVKMILALVRRADLRDMILEVGELWPKNLAPDDQKAVILKAWLRKIKIPLDLYFMFAMMNLGLFELIPFLISCFYLVKGDKVYLFPFQLPKFWEVDSIITYLLTYVWEVVGTVPCQMCLYLPFDLIIVIMTSNVSALLRLLQVDLKNAIKLRDEQHKTKSNLNVSDTHSYEELKRIVDIHQRLLRIADQLSSIFGLVIFIHVACAALEICFFGFLTMVYGGLAETIANMLTVLNAVFTIFLLSLSGQFLCDTSSEVADAAYESYWYESDHKVKKLTLSIIIRAQRPSYLSALGFSQLTLKSFSKIMSSAWTYFSLLIQMYEET
uniref:Odorant receptor n=1 Tax=Helicoverpa armigera TaxID=29058 RepID=A0A7T3N1A8_HELAM|nr:odorant receptor [Helicoverpa armigera]